jgi:hypothetical protein
MSVDVAALGHWNHTGRGGSAAEGGTPRLFPVRNYTALQDTAFLA